MASPADKPDASFAGRTIERYVLEALIGRGGMGEVYRATDTRLRRKVALKLLRPDKHRPDGVDRLFREARAAAALSHPNAVAIHDLGEDDGLFYIVMELVNGMPLLAYVGDDRVSLARKLRWCADIARALASAHKAGVIHRDVKPSNVMISDDDVAKVLDFGLAKPLEPSSVDFRTQAGRVVGTLSYMAPEQLSGGEADARSDQYALGVTAYELFSGTKPAGGPLGAALPLDAVVADFPAEVAGVVTRMMSIGRDERFPSMNDVVTAFEDLVSGRGVRVSLAPSTVANVDLGQAVATEETATVDPSTLDAPADPLEGALEPTMPGEALQRRVAVQARTLLSQEAPPGLDVPAVDLNLKVKDIGTKTANMPGAPGAKAAPPTLVSAMPSPVADLTPRPGAPPAISTERMRGRRPPSEPPGPVLTRSGAPPPASTDEPRSRLPIVVVVLVGIALALAAGIYLGTRMRAPSPALLPSSLPNP